MVSERRKRFFQAVTVLGAGLLHRSGIVYELRIRRARVGAVVGLSVAIAVIDSSWRPGIPKRERPLV
jgi:hypothetical protein